MLRKRSISATSPPTSSTTQSRIIAPLAPENSPIHTYKITYPPLPAVPEPRAHEGYEWFYVLTGRIRLVLGGQDVMLSPGEAAEFDTTTPHSISAGGSRPAQVLSIFNDAGIRMHTHLAGGAAATA
jgi:mannose-6-phosphate isomerase-like protein (cupin superfamily)